RRYAAEPVALAPDVILASTSAAIEALLEATRTVPIVFAGIADPVAAGYVESLARPGRNATGFTVFEYSIAGKWLELLKEIAPRVTRGAVLREPGIAVGPGQFGVIQALAPSLGVELRPIDVREASEIERALTAFAQGPNDGVIVSGSPRATAHRNLIIALAAKHRLPAVYSARFYAVAGGLIAYGLDFLDQYRRAAGYVEARRPAGAAPDQVRFGDQSQDCEGARVRNSIVGTRPRRRGDRIATHFAALHMSAFGTKRTYAPTVDVLNAPHIEPALDSRRRYGTRACHLRSYTPAVRTRSRVAPASSDLPPSKVAIRAPNPCSTIRAIDGSLG